MSRWIADMLDVAVRTPHGRAHHVEPVAGMTSSGELLELISAGGAPWRRDALCREYSHLEWIPRQGDDVEELRAICTRCSVRAECLAEALPNPMTKGIWGGTSGKDRDLHRRGRRLLDLATTACGPCDSSMRGQD